MQSKECKTILITRKTYRRIRRSTSLWRKALSLIPSVYMLGSGADGVIRHAIPLSTSLYKSCRSFPTIKTKSLTKATIEIYKRGLIPCGIARSHRDISTNVIQSATSLGPSIMRMLTENSGFLLMSVNKNHISARTAYKDRYFPSSELVPHKIEVIE